MRLMEECPYITPCGYCSRQQKPCEKKNQAMPGRIAAENAGKLKKNSNETQIELKGD